MTPGLHARLRANRARKHSVDIERWQAWGVAGLLALTALCAGGAAWLYFDALKYRDAGIYACHIERPPVTAYTEVTALIETHQRRRLRDLCPGDGFRPDPTPQPILYAHDGGIVTDTGGPEWALTQPHSRATIIARGGP